MILIMNMTVGMRERFMEMLMRMALGNVRINADAHKRGGANELAG